MSIGLPRRRAEDDVPRLRAGPSSDELIDRGKKSEQTQKLAPSHAHPTTPDGKVGAHRGGRAAGLVDETRMR